MILCANISNLTAQADANLPTSQSANFSQEKGVWTRVNNDWRADVFALKGGGGARGRGPGRLRGGRGLSSGS